MASLKIASLFLRTLSKPIATKIKQRAKDHEGFKSRTIAMAQFLHRAEMNLRVSLLGESPKHIRPLSESRAIESGANFLSEGFLFAVAATIILGETYRSRLSESKRRDAVKDQLESHHVELERVRERLAEFERQAQEDSERRRELANVVEQVVVIGLKGGFGDHNDSLSESLVSDDDNDGHGHHDHSKVAWERHVRIAELAQAFRTAGRVLRDDDDDDEDDNLVGGVNLGADADADERERVRRTTMTTRLGRSDDTDEEGQMMLEDNTTATTTTETKTKGKSSAQPRIDRELNVATPTKMKEEEIVADAVEGKNPIEGETTAKSTDEL